MWSPDGDSNDDFAFSKAVNEWLAAQNVEDLEKRLKKYVTQVFLPTGASRVRSSWPDRIKFDHFVERFTEHRKYATSDISQFIYNLRVVLQSIQ